MLLIVGPSVNPYASPDCPRTSAGLPPQGAGAGLTRKRKYRELRLA